MRTYSCLLSALASGLALLPYFCNASLPEVTQLTPQFFPKYNSQRVKIRYGPFQAPPMDVDNGMKTYENGSIKMPCTDCFLTWIQAGLEYPNGTIANADTGMWLHHTVLANTAQNQVVCPNDSYPDEFFASGNERTPIDICVNGTDKAGYYLGPDANNAMLIELMNMDTVARDAVLTITYEFIPKASADFSKVTVLWLDIGGCFGSSDQPAKPNQVFSYTSPVWQSTITKGRITFIGGHLHDGGTNLVVRKNGQTICDCVAAYGQSAGYIDGPGAMNMPGMNMTDSVHISSISVCTNDGSVNVGDTMSITAHYNTSEWSPMTNTDGSLAPIMGISLVYVAENLKIVAGAGPTTTATSATSEMSMGTSTMSGMDMSSSSMSMSMSMSGSMSMSMAPTTTTGTATGAATTSASSSTSGAEGWVRPSVWSATLAAGAIGLIAAMLALI